MLAHTKMPVYVGKREVENDLSVFRDASGKPLLASKMPVNLNIAQKLKGAYAPRPPPKEHTALWDAEATKGNDMYDKRPVKPEARISQSVYQNDKTVEGTGILLNKYPRSGYHNTGPQPEVRIPEKANADMHVPITSVQGSVKPALAVPVAMHQDTTQHFSQRETFAIQRGKDRMSEMTAGDDREMGLVAPVAIETRGAPISSSFSMRDEALPQLRLPSAPAPKGNKIQATVNVRQSLTTAGQGGALTPASLHAGRKETVRPVVMHGSHNALSSEDRHIMQAALRMPQSHIGAYTLADAGLTVSNMQVHSTAAQPPSLVHRDFGARGADDTSVAVTGPGHRTHTGTQRPSVQMSLADDSSQSLPQQVQVSHTRAAVPPTNVESSSVPIGELPSQSIKATHAGMSHPVKTAAVQTTKITRKGQFHEFLQFVQKAMLRTSHVSSSHQSHDLGTPANIEHVRRAQVRDAKVMARVDPGATKQQARGLASFMKSLLRSGSVRTSMPSANLPEPSRVIAKGTPVQPSFAQARKNSLPPRRGGVTQTRRCLSDPSGKPNQTVAMCDKTQRMRVLGGSLPMNRPVE